MPTQPFQTTVRFAYDSAACGRVQVQATVLRTRHVVINGVRRRGTHLGKVTFWYVELPEDESSDIMNLARWYAEDRGLRYLWTEVCD